MSTTSSGGVRPQCYPTDLMDRQWRDIEPLLVECRANERGRPRSVDMREVVNALNYRWHTGCTWRMLPHDFPAWPTVYHYHRRWAMTGELGALRRYLTRPRGSCHRLPEQSELRIHGESA